MARRPSGKSRDRDQTAVVASDLEDRIAGSLCLAGIGDALGSPTEHCTQAEIATRYGGPVDGYRAPLPGSAAAAAGIATTEVTDDASQLYHLARALVAADGRLDNRGWLRCLLGWADTSGKCGVMGPSTQALVDALRAGRDPFAPAAAGVRKPPHVGITNGAAMRVAPCGLVHPGRPLDACEQALATCLPSHDSDVAIAGACCVAAGVAVALVSDDVGAVVDACHQGALVGERMGRDRARPVPGARVTARLAQALAIAAAAGDDARFLADLEAGVGTSMLAAESVPAAVGILAYARGDPARTVLLAASIGNDSDTIATMAGALAGALRGRAALPSELLAPFLAVNDGVYDLAGLARDLARTARRLAASASPRPGLPSVSRHGPPSVS